MFLFVSIVLSIYALTNYYIVRRGLQALSGHPHLRLIFLIGALFFIACYPLGRFLEHAARNHITGFLITAGAIYLAVMLYAFLWTFLIDIFRLINKIFRLFPGLMSGQSSPAAFRVFWIGLVVITATFIGGSINASRIHIRDVELTIPKYGGAYKDLTIVYASDIHFGTILGRRRLERIVAAINSCQPRLVLLGGDTLDEDITAEKAAELSSILEKVHAPSGVFAVLGNHETYAGIERCRTALRQAGVWVIEDENALIDGSLCLIGRKDLSVLRNKEKRAPLQDLVDPAVPMILMDHQPFHLEEAEKAGIDLQLSGHTHAGQLFPFDLINKRMYEINWGTLKKGATTVVVSSGAGTWGPPVRTAGCSEVVRIRIKFVPDLFQKAF